MAETGDKKRVPSQEKLLVDYVQRLEKHGDGRSLAQLHLSSLRPFNRRDQHLRAAASNFEPLIKDMSGQLFLLKNGDIFFFFKNESRATVETTVQQVKYMFSDDPLVSDEDELHTTFVSWFDASMDFKDIHQTVSILAAAESRRVEDAKNRMDARSALRAKQKMGEPLLPEVLSKIEDALVRADLSNMLRRQYACSIDDNMVPQQVFSELFISIQDLRETLLPDVNLLSNRWLFQHLTETLDRRMLSMLRKTDRISMTGNISFNINIRTLMSQDFISFDDNIAASRRGAMLIELQKEDIFSDLQAYTYVREFAQSRGYRIALDGMTFETLKIMNFKKLGVNIVKLIWNSELVDGGENVMIQVRKMVESMGGENFVLCRCDNREAIDFGKNVGIQVFQGRYIENLIAEDGRRLDLLKLKRRIERSSDDEEEDFGSSFLDDDDD